MTVDTKRVEILMKRCQIGAGFGGASSQLARAHDILAECYGVLGALVQERDRLLSGEHICIKCSLRQDAEGSGISKEF